MAQSRRRPKPREIPLTPEKNTREALTLFRPDQEVTVGPDTPFVLMPGSKGKGYVLRVYEDPRDPEESKPG